MFSILSSETSFSVHYNWNPEIDSYVHSHGVDVLIHKLTFDSIPATGLLSNQYKTAGIYVLALNRKSVGGRKNASEQEGVLHKLGRIKGVLDISVLHTGQGKNDILHRLTNLRLQKNQERHTSTVP